MLVFRGSIDIKAPLHQEEGENQYFIVARPTLDEADNPRLERSTYGGRTGCSSCGEPRGRGRETPGSRQRPYKGPAKDGAKDLQILQQALHRSTAYHCTGRRQAKGQRKDKGKYKDQGKRAGLYSAQKRSAGCRVRVL